MLLPEPVVPMMASDWPGVTSKLMLSSATMPESGYTKRTLSKTMCPLSSLCRLA